MRVEAESRLIVRIGGGAADIVVKRPYAADAARFVQNVADELCLVAPEAAHSALVTPRFPAGGGDVPGRITRRVSGDQKLGPESAWRYAQSTFTG